MLKSPEVQNQVNTYYVSDYLKEHKIALRTRELNGKTQLTTKERYSIEGGYFQSKEDTVEIDVTGDLLESVRKNAKPEFQPEKLEVLLQMKTTRYCETVNGFNFELDEVAVVSPKPFTFWELECETETPEAYLAFVKVQFAQLQIELVFSEVVKMERALRGF